MNTKQLETFKTAVKESIKVGIASGFTSEQIFKVIAAKIGNANTRLIFADLALDYGMVDQTKRYLAQF